MRVGERAGATLEAIFRELGLVTRDEFEELELRIASKNLAGGGLYTLDTSFSPTRSRLRSRWKATVARIQSPWRT